MKNNKILLSALVLGMGVVGAFQYAQSSAANTEPQSTNIMVMKHLCNDSVRSLEDFENIEKGKDPVDALAATVLACPTTGLPGDEAVAQTVASARTNYNFSVEGEKYSPIQMNDAEFTQHKLCESDLNRDVDKDGTVSGTTCLDISHYEFMNLKSQNGKVDVVETNPPQGFRFGTVRFTPTALVGNNDQQSFLTSDVAQGRIKLDVSQDKDKMVMLHVYNFQTGDMKAGHHNHGSENSSQNRTQIIEEIRSKHKEIGKLHEQIAQLVEQLAK